MYPYPVSGEVGNTPKVTNLPFKAYFIPIFIDSRKPSLSFITWSEDSISNKESLPFSNALEADKAIAGAVPRPNGSNKIEFGLTWSSLICSAVINLCSSLQIKIY